jgi:hypothetical protein
MTSTPHHLHRRSRLALGCAVALSVVGAASATSLQEMYELAGAGGGYDKYIELQTGVTYTGGLFIGATFNRITAQFIGEGLDVRIVGNGAILDLRGAQIAMAYCTNRLDIDDCIIINGDVRFRGYSDAHMTLIPQGSIEHVTFYRPHDYAVRLYGSGSDIVIERCIFVNAVDTGPDFTYLNGEANDWLPTGANVAWSNLAWPQAFENWSYHTDPAANADMLRHFGFL